MQKKKFGIIFEFCQILEITPEQFHAYKDKYRSRSMRETKQEIEKVKSESPESVSGNIKKIFEDIKFLSGLPNIVNILKGEAMDGSDICVKGSTLIVDETIFNRLNRTVKEKEVTMRHEMQHIIFEDSLNAYVLKTLKIKKIFWKTPWGKDFNIGSWNKLVDRWHCFKEHRADQLALINIECIKARIDFWKRYLRTSEPNDDDHDSPQNRLALAESMLSDIQKETEKMKAEVAFKSVLTFSKQPGKRDLSYPFRPAPTSKDVEYRNQVQKEKKRKINKGFLVSLVLGVGAYIASKIIWRVKSSQ